MQNFSWPQMTMGVCYYPEHWPESLWAEDLDRMLEAGISVIRIGEFAWNKFEPEEGKFTYDFFDRFLQLCGQKGMKVIFGTPTATPPAWLTSKYPEVLNADRNGVKYRHGGRRHCNYNSPKYRELCARVVEKIAQHCGPHPAIIGWQIDNELNCEVGEFYSDADSVAFREFLKEKYGSLERLNGAWGCSFWNQDFTDWEQVDVPKPVLNEGWNPHMRLDYFRFVSHSARSFCRLQAEILKKYRNPGDFIMTNGLFGNLDNHQMAEESLDLIMYDSYPNFAFGLDRTPGQADDLNDRKWTRNLIETRSVSPHFGIMEQQSGANGWTTRMEGPAPRPGQLTLWAMQSVAQGADFVSFFRWRTCTFGTEMYWHGILDYDNRDNRKLAEVKDFYRKFRALGPVCGARNIAAFGFLKDYDNLWDAQADVWHERLMQQSEKEIFCAAELNHTPYDVVCLREQTTLEQLQGYPVLVYPHPMIMTRRRAELLEQYVKQGGTLILGCRSGMKDENGRFEMTPQPGLLRALTGTDVRDFTFVSPAEEPVTMDWNGRTFHVPVFNDILEPSEGTEVLAEYRNSYYAGKAAMTVRRYGRGKAIHFGGTFSREIVRELFRYTGILEPFSDDLTAPEEVQVALREKDGIRYYFVLNYMSEEREIMLKQPMELLYTGEILEGRVRLGAFETAVYQKR